MPGPIITLLTDFGVSDAYVGAMKGVMLSISPAANIVDVSHEVPSQDILAAAMMLPQYVPFYPEGSVHVAVVDPGVGSERKALVIETESCFLVGPDNGILSQLLMTQKLVRAVEITSRELMLPEVASTFHGRDIFSPAAAHLAAGVPMGRFGPEVTSLVKLDAPLPEKTDTGLRGQIVVIDRFGNAISNIPERWLHSQPIGRIRVKGLKLKMLHSIYSDVAEGEAVALCSSSGMLEFAINGGSAAEECGLGTGDEVVVEII